jgi:hypothetical protein
LKQSPHRQPRAIVYQCVPGAQASGLDPLYVGAWDHVGAQQLSQGVRVNGVNLDLGGGDCPQQKG